VHKQGFSVPAQACAVAVLAGAVLLLAAPYLWTGRWNTFALDQSLNDQTGYVTAARSLAERGRLESSVYYAGLLPQVKSHNVIYMPGAYYVRAAFFAIFGFSVFTSTLPNLLAFVASCVLSFLIGARLAGPRSGWISSLFVIFYPPFLLYAYSRSELLLSFLCLLVCWAFLASSPRIQDRWPGPDRTTVSGARQRALAAPGIRRLSRSRRPRAPRCRGSPASRSRP
jgi:4-amino-4-deoxy-L-arabinose transferase-like glycosyltransferase